MGSTEQQASGQQQQEYLTKKVKLNGQFVTLYSLNGQTWLSSPEEIPEVMARLENTRITLSAEGQDEGEEPAEGQEAKPDEKKAAEKKPAEKAPPPPPVQIASKYRLKGPKPRPILRQNGMTFKGTPVEPFSASEVQVKAAPAKGTPKNAKVAKAKGKAKLTAPVLSETRAAAAAAAKAAALAAAKAKKAAEKAALKAAAQKNSKGKTVPVVAKSSKAPAPKAAKAISKAAPKRPAPSAKKPVAAKPGRAKASKPAAKKGKGGAKRR